MPTKKKTVKKNSRAGKVPVLVFLDVAQHRTLKTKLPRGNMAPFVRAAITLALTPKLYARVKNIVVA